MIAETPTFFTEIMAKIVSYLRKLLTKEQKKVLVDAVVNLSQLNIQCRKNFKEFVDMLNSVPLYALTGF